MSDDYGTEGGGGGLYDTGPSSPPPQPKPRSNDGYWCNNCSRVLCDKRGETCQSCRDLIRAHASRTSPTSEPDPGEALMKTAAVVANPASLVVDAVDPTQTKLPMGVAILGLCIVAAIWADSMSKK